ncbi:hypothetical protein MB818_08710 [Ruegeria sp. 1NDH52C]|uniref:Uncharacterized protein n=1 Tax=Ruegeria alba TaxID=2916756 RepID=A0ABS9NVP1_9RHOB|nr:hypothetical protein [Ruegeria alba]MCG6558278.1 hypothetical protein [Ruegeria alba]
MTDTEEPNSEIMPKAILPSDYMRARRPEQFSDTQDADEQILERGFFEYHLDTLTSRNEEKLFEHFAKKLCQKLICPNLIPQTGPTGGGDSKVDSETYPVSSEIADRWFLGVDAASERWGFAFSAKQDWRPKCKSDIKKIAETNRDYRAAYFVTNQFVPDRKRAELEDELTKEHGFSVRILDRSWLVEVVIDKGNEDIAIDTLGLSVPTYSRKKIGRGDQEKIEALEHLENRISDLTQRPSVDLDLVDDCLEAAIYSRELEETREITEGRFERAERHAREVGVQRLILSVIYQRAWTACYWFNDFSAVSSLYDEIEEIALASDRSEDVECAVNIWQSLNSLNENGLLTEPDKHKERTDRLLCHLENVAAEIDRPNNAANARGFLILVRIILEREDAERVGEHLQDIDRLFEDAQNLGGFQFQRFREIFEFFGQVFGEHPAYDEVFESVLTIVEKRNSESAAGQQLYERGIQKIHADHPYDAIRFLGRAMARFIKYEERRHLESCLGGLAQAYGACGLFWAEYCALMSLLSMLLKRFEDDHSIHVRNGMRVISAQLTWNCLRTGNVPGFLYFYKLEKILEARQQEEAGEAEDKSGGDEINTRDIILSIALLQVSNNQINTLAYLPDHLEQLGLLMSCLAINFLLGGTKRLRQENFFPVSASDEEIWEMISQALSQPARKQVPDTIELRDGESAVLHSMLLGAEWKVVVENDFQTVRVAQSFLGFLEALLATSLNEEIIPTAATIELRFCALAHDDPSAHPLLSFQEDENHNYCEILVNTKRFERASEYMPAMRDAFMEMFARVLTTFTMIRDVEGFLDRIAGQEEGFNRALIFSDMVTTATNVFSNPSEETLEEFVAKAQPIEDTVSASFKAKLQSVVEASKPSEESDEDGFNPGKGEPPPDLVDFDRLSHRQRRVLSPINLKKWDKAGWIGVAMGTYPGVTPILGLIFENEGAATSIFQDWRNQCGEEDVDDAIRVAIVRGLTVSDPHGYGLIIGANWQKAKSQPGEMMVTISRIKHMEHPNPQNLERFIREYQNFGGFLLAPAISVDGFKDVHFVSGVALAKRDLHIRQAWEIGENDPDSTILLPEHEPIIPDGVDDPPVNALMARKRTRAAEEASKRTGKGKPRKKSKHKRMWRP